MVKILNTTSHRQKLTREHYGATLQDEFGTRKDMFGEPVLRSFGNSRASWSTENALNQLRHGGYGWSAELVGSKQTGNDWASIWIPVDEMPITDLEGIKMMYYLRTDESPGLSITLWIHDPNDLDKRAEVSLYSTGSGSHTPPPSAAGWNFYSTALGRAADVWFQWSENCTDSAIGQGGGNGTTLKAYQEDILFKNFTIYRAEIYWGWMGSGDLDECWVGSVKINDVDIPLKPSAGETAGIMRDTVVNAQKVLPTWKFGQPTLMAQNNGRAHWARGSALLSTHQKGSTGWVAQLNGGVQSAWDDAAEVYIPVNEMPLTSLKTGSTMWSWFQTATEIAGVGMVVWVHDPDDFDKRAEISMLTEVGHVELSAGWNAHELADGNDCVWYGENTGTHDTTVTAGTAYNFNQFLLDDVFSTYTIYRISFAYGFQTSGVTFDDVYLADVKINGEVIRLVPDIQRWKRTINTQKTLDAELAYTAEDVMSEDPTNGQGTDWDFDFGASGKIVQAVIATENNGITAAIDLYLFTRPPTSELDDHAANSAPAVADLPYFIGVIEFAAMADVGGVSYAVSTGLEMSFDTNTIYGIAVDTSGQDFLDDKTLDIDLTAELEA